METPVATVTPRVMPTPRPGDHIVVAPGEVWTPSTGAANRLSAELEALGYSEGEVPGEGQAGGVLVHEAAAFKGYTFVTLAASPGAALLDMEGREVWRWSMALHDVWPSMGRSEAARNLGWRRAVLLPDGDVVAIWSSHGVVRLDRNGRLKWAHRLPVHHDLQVHEDGTVTTLLRRERAVDLRADKALVDTVATLGADGTLLSELDLYDVWRAHPDFQGLWDSHAHRSTDLFHTNSVRVLDDGLAAAGLPAGHLLLSMRRLDSIAVVDPSKGVVVWHLEGEFRQQHDPHVVAPGRILIFDNRGLHSRSRVMEWDVAAEAMTWSFVGSPQTPFFTQDCGHAQRLPNGNTLMVESARGRVLEVDAGGTVVWSWRTGERTAEGKVARVFEAERVAPDGVAWLSP